MRERMREREKVREKEKKREGEREKSTSFLAGLEYRECAVDRRVDKISLWILHCQHIRRCHMMHVLHTLLHTSSPFHPLPLLHTHLSLSLSLSLFLSFSLSHTHAYTLSHTHTHSLSLHLDSIIKGPFFRQVSLNKLQHTALKE